MKNVIQLLSIVLITSLPFLSTAQFSVGILTAPFSKITTTRVLVPIAAELKFAANKSVVLEYGIPVYSQKAYQYNEKSASYSVEFRKYKSTLGKRGFKKYYAFKFSHTAESYSLQGRRFYRTKDVRHSFDYAEMNSKINSFSVKWGLQKVFKNRMILDFNVGISLRNKSVKYKNVANETQMPANGLGKAGFSPNPYYSYPVLFRQPDRLAISHTYISIPMSIRIGYLINR